MYKAIIEAPKEVEELFSSKDFSSDRVQVDQGIVNGVYKFTISAKDSVVLRAVCNSLTKLLTVWEKMEKV